MSHVDMEDSAFPRLHIDVGPLGAYHLYGRCSVSTRYSTILAHLCMTQEYQTDLQSTTQIEFRKYRKTLTI
jgi:hypothetical protein